jgi:hypothetical protein
VISTRLRISAAVAASALVAAGAALAASPPIGALPAGWSHAEINVMIKGKPHTFILDRGRVQSMSSSVVVLRERDGSVVSVPVGARTKVHVNGQPGSLSDVQPGYTATTVRLDGGAARELRAFRPRRTR